MRKPIRHLLLAALLLPAIAIPDSAPMPQNAGVQSLRVQPVFENSDGSAPSSKALPSRPLLVFHMVAGTMAGYFPGVSLADLPARSEGRNAFDIDINSRMTIAWSRARPADKMPASMSITPAETRIGDVTAVAYAGGGRLGTRFLGNGQGFQFRTQGQRGTHRLAFFDRACRTSGSVGTPDGEIGMEIEIPAPGFYFLALKRTADSRRRLVAEPATTVDERELVITFY